LIAINKNNLDDEEKIRRVDAIAELQKHLVRALLSGLSCISIRQLPTIAGSVNPFGHVRAEDRRRQRKARGILRCLRRADRPGSKGSRFPPPT
jgi:hypothetical protein